MTIRNNDVLWLYKKQTNKQKVQTHNTQNTQQKHTTKNTQTKQENKKMYVFIEKVISLNNFSPKYIFYFHNQILLTKIVK